MFFGVCLFVLNIVDACHRLNLVIHLRFIFRLSKCSLMFATDDASIFDIYIVCSCLLLGFYFLIGCLLDATYKLVRFIVNVIIYGSFSLWFLTTFWLLVNGVLQKCSSRPITDIPCLHFQSDVHMKFTFFPLIHFGDNCRQVGWWVIYPW